MPLALKVGFDDKVIGEYRIRDGKIEVVADTPGARAELDGRLETYMRQMVEYHGFDPATIAPEDVLRWIPQNTTQGRNWTQLEE